MKVASLAGALALVLWACNPPAGTHGVKLQWNASAGAQSYIVLRDGMQIATSVTTSWVDTSVEAGKSYTYCVEAFDGAASPCSASVTAVIP